MYVHLQVYSMHEKMSVEDCLRITGVNTQHTHMIPVLHTLQVPPCVQQQ